jgi:hypothetical protein
MPLSRHAAPLPNFADDLAKIVLQPGCAPGISMDNPNATPHLSVLPLFAQLSKYSEDSVAPLHWSCKRIDAWPFEDNGIPSPQHKAVLHQLPNSSMGINLISVHEKQDELLERSINCKLHWKSNSCDPYNSLTISNETTFAEANRDIVNRDGTEPLDQASSNWCEVASSCCAGKGFKL